MPTEETRGALGTCPHIDAHKENGEIVCDECNAVVDVVAGPIDPVRSPATVQSVTPESIRAATAREIADWLDKIRLDVEANMVREKYGVGK